MGCDHNCGSCGGCKQNAGTLELTAEEIAMLEQLGQFAFLPVARRADDMTPMYFEEDSLSADTCSLVLQLLEKKGLISLDYDKPLGNSYGEKYAPYPVRGSFALTQRGQKVLEILEIEGIS